jgi:hypothetical protein
MASASRAATRARKRKSRAARKAGFEIFTVKAAPGLVEAALRARNKRPPDVVLTRKQTERVLAEVITWWAGRWSRMIGRHD